MILIIFLQLLSLLIASLLLLAAYRLTVHPLASYPGPLCARITDWYSVYHAWKGDQHLDFYRLHNHYGEYVRYGPNRVSVNSAAALQAVYGANANTEKSSFYSVFNHFFSYPSTETVIDKSHHAIKRRLLSKALSETKMKSMETSLLANVDTCCSLLADAPLGNNEAEPPAWSQPKDVGKLMRRFGFDAMGDICFGRNLNTMESPKNRYLINVISDGAQGLNIVGHMPWLLTARLDRVFFSRLIQGLGEYKNYSSILAQQCLKEGEKPKSVIRFMIGDKDAELDGPMSKLEIISSETTSTALANTIFHTLHYPSTLRRLTGEIRDKFTNLEDIKSGVELSDCVYLRACIDESLRLSPPVGGLLPRVVLAGGLDIGDHHFQEGTELGVPVYCLHRNEALFAESSVYKPERWLVEDCATNKAGIPACTAAFGAFSIGPRSCIGKRMAYMELTILIARMLWLYDMQLAPIALRDGQIMSAREALEDRDRRSIDKFVTKVSGPLVVFKKR